MSDTDRARVAGATDRPRCKFGRTLDTFPEHTATTITTRLKDTSGAWPDHKLADILVKAGRTRVSGPTMVRHRLGYCACYTTTESEAA